MAFISKDIQKFFIDAMINYGYVGSDFLASFRLYGFASNLTFTMPIFQMIISVLLIYFAIKGKLLYLLPVPIIFFSGIINARISLVIFVVGILTLFVVLLLRKKRFFLISSLAFFSLSVIVFILSNKSFFIDNITFAWIYDGIEEIISFFNGNSDETYYFSYLLDPIRYVLPSNFIQLIFGVGTRAYSGNLFGLASDLGFINDVWLGGFFYLTLLYMFFYFIINKIAKLFIFDKTLQFFLLSFFLIVFFLSNIKGIIFAENDVTTFIFLFLPFLMKK
jgi:hypothetical protein